MQNEKHKESRLAIVTGASGGIGSEIALGLAREGYVVILACRNAEKAESVRQRIIRESGNPEVESQTLDLASFRSVREFAARMAERLRPSGQRISLLVNNAGTMCKEFTQSEDGYETTLAVNYLGTVLLTELLLPFMAGWKADTETIVAQASDGVPVSSIQHTDTRAPQENTSGTPTAQDNDKVESHIVVTVSCTAWWKKLDEHLFETTTSSYNRMAAYSRSKLAVLIYTAELSERLARNGISVHAADPGTVNTGMITMHRWFDPLTDLLFRPWIRSPRKGAKAALRAAHSTISGCIFYAGRKTNRKIPCSIFRHPKGPFLKSAILQIFNSTQKR